LGETIGAPLKPNRKIRIDTFVEPDVYEMLIQIAKRKELPRARIIEKAIVEYLERHKKELEV